MQETWRATTAGVITAGIIVAGALCAGCGGASGAAGQRPASPAPASPAPASPASASPAPASPGPAGSAPAGTAPASPASGTPRAGTATPGTAAALPLAGKVVGIDPGHNGGNFSAPGYLARQVWNGRTEEDCDTTGTQTVSGYTEAQFTFNVASDLRPDLIALGARVVMTRHGNRGVGPCVTTRTQIINRALANVAIDIHADGGPSYGRGFTVLEPVADGPNDKVIGASVRFGADVRAAMLRYTSMPESDYYGHDGLIFRDDLAGLNLTTVPKVLLECGNMQNPVDAALLIRPSFQRRLARALTAAIVAFVTGHG